jgi:hypothetical protein
MSHLKLFWRTPRMLGGDGNTKVFPCFFPFDQYLFVRLAPCSHLAGQRIFLSEVKPAVASSRHPLRRALVAPGAEGRLIVFFFLTHALGLQCLYKMCALFRSCCHNHEDVK